MRCSGTHLAALLPSTGSVSAPLREARFTVPCNPLTCSAVFEMENIPPDEVPALLAVGRFKVLHVVVFLAVTHSPTVRAD